MNVSLNAQEQEIVKAMAFKRIKNNRANGVQDWLITDSDDYWNEVQSYGAELAYGKLFNLYPDFGMTHAPQDFTDHAGRTIDVKQTKYQNGKLIARMKQWDRPADLFALMVGVFPDYRLAGYMRSKDLLQESRIDNSLPTPAYAAKQEELLPPEWGRSAIEVTGPVPSWLVPPPDIDSWFR